jgi:DNA-binding CsgD family transcriptional regulator
MGSSTRIRNTRRVGSGTEFVVDTDDLVLGRGAPERPGPPDPRRPSGPSDRLRETTPSTLKTAAPEEIADAVERVARSETVFTPSLAGLVISESRRVATPRTGDPALTDRENEALVLVAKGYTYREISQKLFISLKTVQNHVYNILKKLQLRRRYELMRYAIERGIDRLPE